MKPKHVWILEEGRWFNDRGVVVCASKSKAGLIRWIRENYPEHVRKSRSVGVGEIYFENEEDQTWLRCEPVDRCPLVD